MVFAAVDPPDRVRATVAGSVVELRRDPNAGFDIVQAYGDHGGPLFAFAYNALSDRAQAEDCVQETMVRAWRARDTYSPERATVRTWLFTIARRVVIDAYRARDRRPRPVDVSTAGRTPATGDDMAASLDRILVTEALARLTDEHREVVVQVRLRGVSYEELSRHTGVPVATLRTRMYHGLRAMRVALKEAGEGHD